MPIISICPLFTDNQDFFLPISCWYLSDLYEKHNHDLKSQEIRDLQHFQVIRFYLSLNTYTAQA